MYFSGLDENKKIYYPSDKLLLKFTSTEQAYQPSFLATVTFNYMYVYLSLKYLLCACQATSY